MINNEHTRQWLDRLVAESETPIDWGNAMPVDVIEPEDIAAAVAWLVSDEARYVTASRCRWTRATSTSADGAKSRRADRLRPDGAGSRRAVRGRGTAAGRRRPRPVVPACRLTRIGARDAVPPLRRLMMSARLSGPDPARGHSSPAASATSTRNSTSRLPRHRRRRRSSGQGWTPGRTASRADRRPGIRGRPAGEHRAQAGRRAAGDRRCTPSVHLVPLDFERDDLIAALARHGYRTEAGPSSSGKA